MNSSSSTQSPHDLAIVRTLQAMLAEAVDRADHDVARDLAEQIEHEIRRQDGRWSRR